MPWWRYLLGTVILFVGCGAIYGGLHVCMGLGKSQSAGYVGVGLNNSQTRAPYVEPTAAVINWIISTMQDEIARVEEIVANVFRETLEATRASNQQRVRDAWMYRGGFAERFLRYKLEGRSNLEICDVEGAARRPWALMLWPRRALDSACYVFAQLSVMAR